MKLTTSLRVKSLSPISNDCLQIILEKSENFYYQPGDCVDISFPDALDLGKQTYSFASSPHEDVLMLAFKKGYSEFKHRLQALKSGDFLQATQYGSNFIFNQKIPSVMIAGGIGITPFRSMIKTRLIEHPDVQTILIFQNRTLDFPFYTELQTWDKECPSLEIIWIDSDTKGRLTPELLKSVLQERDTVFHYYVAGPPLMVDASIELLTKLKIQTQDIHTDSFDGYLDDIS